MKNLGLWWRCLRANHFHLSAQKIRKAWMKVFTGSLSPKVSWHWQGAVMLSPGADTLISTQPTCLDHCWFQLDIRVLLVQRRNIQIDSTQDVTDNEIDF